MFFLHYNNSVASQKYILSDQEIIFMKSSITFKKLILLFFSIIAPFFLITISLLQQNNTALRSRRIAQLQEKVDLTVQTLTESPSA